MNVGLIARSEDRGLGIQSWEWARAMRPDRVLLVDGSTHQVAFPQHPERFPGATVVRLNPGWPEPVVRDWLAGLDVVYAVETLYDWRIAEWARDLGVATVVHANPEFYRHHREAFAHPTTWWLPTSWRADAFPDGRVVIPVPVPLDRWPEPNPPTTNPPVWLHVVGHRAMADRNGTLLFFAALRHLNEPARVVIATQDARLPAIRAPRHVTIERRAHVDDYWRLYDDVDAVVLPRRYGGLCLPVLEASGAGVPVIMSDAEPQRTDWPHVETVASTSGGRPITAQTGKIALVNADPRALAAAMDRHGADPSGLRQRARLARGWAETHSWDVWAPRYRALLTSVASRS